MEITRATVVAWLRQQSDREFFETIYAAGSGRGPHSTDQGWLESHVVAGYAWREKSSHGHNPWAVQLVALPSEHGAGPDETPAEAGSHCGQDLISWSKSITCPLCGDKTYAT